MPDVLQILLPVALLGLAVNAEPGQVVVLTVLLGGRRPHRDTFAFLAGWGISLTVCFVAARALVRLLPNQVGTTEAQIIAVLEIVLAVGLVWFATHEWRRRARPRPTEAPKALARLEDLGPRVAFVAGIFEQPWTMTIAAGMVVVRSQASTLETVAAGLVFAVTSTLTLVGAYAYFETHGTTAVERLKSLERRITSAGPSVIAVAAAISALAFLADGIHSLFTK